jgi:hypothetical protein
MIIRDLNIMRPIGLPFETYPPLVVDSNAVLALPIAFQSLQLVAGWNAQVTYYCGSLQLQQFASRNPLNILESPNCLAIKERLGFGARE